MVGTDLFLYFSHNLVLKLTALVGNPLWSNAKGSEPFGECGYCTVSIRRLALLELNIVAEIVLYYYDKLGFIN
jgi:hypothetical protein